jgi:hypothetical protein
LPFYIPDNIKIFGIGSITIAVLLIALTRPFAVSVIDGIDIAFPYVAAAAVIFVKSVFALAKAAVMLLFCVVLTAIAALADAKAELAYDAAELAIADGNRPLASFAAVIVPFAMSAAITVPSAIESEFILLSAIYLFSVILSIY